jgi:hypothetical protein
MCSFAHGVGRYEQFKIDVYNNCQTNNLTMFSSQIGYVLGNLNYWAKILHEESMVAKVCRKLSSFFSHDKEQEKLLFFYNFLRELVDEKLAPSFELVDYAWLARAQKEAIPLAIQVEGGLLSAIAAQRHLVEQAKELLGINDQLYVFSEPEFGGSSKNSFSAVCQTPDLGTGLYTVYHELGHIINQDSKELAKIRSGSKSYKDILENPYFVADMNAISRYVELGKTVFDREASFGRHVHRILEMYDSSWNLPPHVANKEEALYAKGVEKRADLFALEKLFEHDKLPAILQAIARHALYDEGDEVIVTPGTAHYPCDIERVLYMAGFLAENGIDINSAMR